MAIGESTDKRSIRAVIDSRHLVTHFQPIISTRQRTIVGLEALARVRHATGHQAVSAHWLFQAAARESVTTELEQICCEGALTAFAKLPERHDGLLLFLNAGGWLTSQPGALETLSALARREGVSADKIAIEILEARIDDLDSLPHLVEQLRAAGFLLALDDVGTGHSNLDRILLIKPDILKIDRRLIAQIDTDFHKQEMLKSLLGLSRKIGALVVAEGVETEGEAIVALELGADLMQGYFLSRPSENGSLMPVSEGEGTQARIEALGQKFKRYMVGKINERKLQHRRFNIIQNEVLCHLSNADVGQFDEILRGALEKHPHVECIYILDNKGIQVTETICNQNVTRKERGVLFHPASKSTDHSLKEYYYILLDVELQKFTTDPYVSFASGNLCRTISTYFRDAHNNGLYVLCIDIAASGQFAPADIPS